MTPLEWSLWVTVLAAGIAGSALFSGLETGAYSLNRVRLQILEHRGERRAILLQRLLRNPAGLLGTLLIGNNITNYMGTGALAVILDAQGFGDWQTVIVNCLIVTPILFVLGETLPKDLFSAHADRLMYPFARLLTAARRLFAVIGMLPLVTGFSHGIMRLMRVRGEEAAFHPRRIVSSLVREGVGTGILSEEQSAMVERVLRMSQRTLGEEMTPWSRAVAIRADEPTQRLWELADRTSHSRFPVVEARGEVPGVVHALPVLRDPRLAKAPLRSLMIPVLHVNRNTPARAALRQLQNSPANMLIVVDDRRRPVGIATTKDLVEPLTGELSSW